MAQKTKCSKNYINCRKHPPRVDMSPSERTKKDFAASHTEAVSVFKTAEKELKTVEPSDSDFKRKKIIDQTKQAEIMVLATLPQNNYDELTNKTKNPIWSFDGTKIMHKDLLAIASARKNKLETIKTNVEKEDYYSTPPQLSNFDAFISDFLAKRGEFHDPTQNSWGDTRGTILPYDVNKHFQECGVQGLDDYQEDASWDIYDSYNENNYSGLSAKLSCKCGEYFKKPVYIEPSSFGDLMKDVFNHTKLSQ